MWNQLRHLLRVTPGSDRAGTTRPTRLRPSLELLETRALLSVAPAGQVNWLEIGNQSGGSVQLPTAQDVSISVSYSAKFQFPTDILAGGNSQGSVKQTDYTSIMPDQSAQDGGMVDLGSFHENFHSDLYSSQPTDASTPDTTADPLPTLQYMPRSVPMGTANNNSLPGSVVFGEAAAISAAGSTDATQRIHSSTTTGLFDATSKSVPTGQSEKALVEANQGSPRLPIAESSAKREVETSDGGMITLPRESVVDESVENLAAAIDEDPSTLEIPLEVERTYGRFQAFEVSTGEEESSVSLRDEDGAPTTRPAEHYDAEPAATPVLKSAAHQRVKAVDALFALASSVDEILDQEGSLEQADGGVAQAIADAPAADIQTSKSTTDETRDASMSPTRALSSLPMSTAAAAVVFAAITRTTRRPRRQDERLGMARN